VETAPCAAGSADPGAPHQPTQSTQSTQPTQAGSKRRRPNWMQK
jgi:hypothetical protein